MNQDHIERVAALTGITPLQVLFIYLSQHYDGVANYVKARTAGDPCKSFESIEGKLDDLIKYSTYLKALLEGEAGDKACHEQENPYPSGINFPWAPSVKDHVLDRDPDRNYRGVPDLPAYPNPSLPPVPSNYHDR